LVYQVEYNVDSSTYSDAIRLDITSSYIHSDTTTNKWSCNTD